MSEKLDQVWVENASNNEVSTRNARSKLEKSLLLKMDVSILPLLGLSFFVVYMVRDVLVCIDWTSADFKQDRNNLGNARIMGMQTDLGFSNEQFYNCLMVFCTLSVPA